MFFAANLTKLVHGAWLPLLIGIIAFTVMTTWQRGREIVTGAREKAEGPLREFIDEATPCDPPLARIPGTAVFLNRGSETTPLAMRANVKHNRVLHEHVVIMSLDTVPVPRVPDAERAQIDDLGYASDGIFHVNARFGYMETPNVPRALRLLDPSRTEGQIAIEAASYFLSKLELTKGDAPTMARWRKQLFIATSYIAADAADFFSLPLDRTVIMGSRIEIKSVCFSWALAAFTSSAASRPACLALSWASSAASSSRLALSSSLRASWRRHRAEVSSVYRSLSTASASDFACSAAVNVSLALSRCSRAGSRSACLA